MQFPIHSKNRSGNIFILMYDSEDSYPYHLISGEEGRMNYAETKYYEDFIHAVSRYRLAANVDAKLSEFEGWLEEAKREIAETIAIQNTPSTPIPIAYPTTLSLLLAEEGVKDVESMEEEEYWQMRYSCFGDESSPYHYKP